MGTRSIIAVRRNDGWAGRYVHWDGYPDGVGDAVRRIVKRDGRETAVRVLLEENYGWSSVDGEDQQDLGTGYEDGRFKAVPGYGIAYTTKDNQSHPEWWLTKPEESWTEYVHIIEDDGTVTSISFF